MSEAAFSLGKSVVEPYEGALMYCSFHEHGTDRVQFVCTNEAAQFSFVASARAGG